jgi:hypothetical protein
MHEVAPSRMFVAEDRPRLERAQVGQPQATLFSNHGENGKP